MLAEFRLEIVPYLVTAAFNYLSLDAQYFEMYIDNVDAFNTLSTINVESKFVFEAVIQ